MERQDIEELIALMKENGITELSLETPELKISLKRQAGAVEAETPTTVATEAPEPAQSAEEPETEAAPDATREPAPVISPVVGIFHNGGMLDPRRLFAEGDPVAEGELLAAIESMKIPNELRCPFAGRVSKVLVKDGEPVQYGQALFLIEPEAIGHEVSIV